MANLFICLIKPAFYTWLLVYKAGFACVLLSFMHIIELYGAERFTSLISVFILLEVYTSGEKPMKSLNHRVKHICNFGKGYGHMHIHTQNTFHNPRRTKYLYHC